MYDANVFIFVSFCWIPAAVTSSSPPNIDDRLADFFAPTRVPGTPASPSAPGAPDWPASPTPFSDTTSDMAARTFCGMFAAGTTSGRPAVSRDTVYQAHRRGCMKILSGGRSRPVWICWMPSRRVGQ
jgi:hypothetical protein